MFKSSSPTLERCTIGYNDAPEGAGMRLYGSNAVINHTAIVDNTAGSGARLGGGISCVYSSSPVLTNCTFNGNEAGNGGAILCYCNSTVTLLNGILWDDAPQEIYIKRQATYPSTVSVDYSDVEGGEGGQFVGLGSDLDWGDGNLDPDGDPLFVDAGTGDYHLQGGSPCIDAGDPDSPDDPDFTDADMGAYYYDQAGGRAPKLDVPAEVVVAPKAFSLGNAYPNPFNGAVRIPFSVPVSARVNVTLYDLNGRQVARLVDEIKPAGFHEVGWVANNAPSGIYLVRMSTAQYRKTQRLVLIK
jgi:predicted outer membrane repeat protein